MEHMYHHHTRLLGKRSIRPLSNGREVYVQSPAQVLPSDDTRSMAMVMHAVLVEHYTQQRDPPNTRRKS